MTKTQSVRKEPVQEVHKPYLTGSIIDERTARNSLAFFGSLIVVFFISFIACASTSSIGTVFRLIMNTAVIILALIIFFNNGANKGADAVTFGEILYQKQEKGNQYSESEKRICFHPLKGFSIGLLGTLPFLIPAVILACGTSLQTTNAGMIPSWMQAFVRRSDIGNALVSYTQPEQMTFVDYIRVFIRICILPFVNLIGYESNKAMVLLERLSPLILLLPGAAYGSGYLNGTKIRNRIHTAISADNRKRRRKAAKKRNARRHSSAGRGPENLN